MGKSIDRQGKHVRQKYGQKIEKTIRQVKRKKELTGNEILAAAQASLKTMGIQHAIYTHPLGVYGHAPGPTIGMWDNQGPTVGRGDWPLYPMTGYAIEGNVTVAIPEWSGQLVQMKLEQSALFDGERVHYLADRQKALHVVGF